MSRASAGLRSAVGRLDGELRVARRGRAHELKVARRTSSPVISKRDSARALDFLREPQFATNGNGPSEGFRRQVEAQESLRRSPDVKDRVFSTYWYHTIELPGGVVTPGPYDHRPLVPRYHLPDTLTGRRVLDVATFNGFWAFELERRGADVVALDLPSTLDIDLPPCARARAVTEDIGMPLSVGFEIAAEALGSTVSLRHGSVYSLDPESWGTFDFVHIGDLLLHLEQPLEALRRVRTVTDGVLHLSDAYDPTLPRGGVRYLGGWRGAQWWIPSIDTLCQWVIDAGFADAVVLDTYRLNPTSEPGGIWRAIIRATT